MRLLGSCIFLAAKPRRDRRPVTANVNNRNTHSIIVVAVYTHVFEAIVYM
jgi:hypothetical protein